MSAGCIEGYMPFKGFLIKARGMKVHLSNFTAALSKQLNNFKLVFQSFLDTEELHDEGSHSHKYTTPEEFYIEDNNLKH